MKPISIVVNMMTYNDAVYIPTVIPQLQLFADRLIVQDNGSDDATRIMTSSILRDQDVHILHNQGDQPDYAELRNNMLGFVQDGEWVLKWDSDELPSIALIERLKNFLEDNPKQDGWTIPCYHIMKDPHECLPIEVGFGHMCLFRKQPWTTYRGSVHEQVVMQGAVGSISPASGIAIIHFSYFAERRFREKAKSYASLPGSGYKDARQLTSRLAMKTVPLPSHVLYDASPYWLEQLKEAP